MSEKGLRRKERGAGSCERGRSACQIPSVLVPGAPRGSGWRWGGASMVPDFQLQKPEGQGQCGGDLFFPLAQMKKKKKKTVV